MDWFKWFRRRPPVAPAQGTGTLELLVALRPSSFVPPLPAQQFMPPVTNTTPEPPPAAKTPTSLTTADGTTRVVLQRFPAQHRAVLLPLALAIVEADKTVPPGMVQRVVLDTLAALASRKRRAGGCRNGRCGRTVPQQENLPAQK